MGRVVDREHEMDTLGSDTHLSRSTTDNPHRLRAHTTWTYPSASTSGRGAAACCSPRSRSAARIGSERSGGSHGGEHTSDGRSDSGGLEFSAFCTAGGRDDGTNLFDAECAYGGTAAVAKEDEGRHTRAGRETKSRGGPGSRSSCRITTDDYTFTGRRRRADFAATTPLSLDRDVRGAFGAGHDLHAQREPFWLGRHGGVAGGTREAHR